MALPHVPADSLLQFSPCPRLRGSVGENRPVNIFPGVSRRSPHHDLLAFFIPLQDRSGTNPEPPAHFGGHRNLTLRGDF